MCAGETAGAVGLHTFGIVLAQELYCTEHVLMGKQSSTSRCTADGSARVEAGQRQLWIISQRVVCELCDICQVLMYVR